MVLLLCCRGRPACTTGSLAHQKSSGDTRQLTPLFREQRLQFGHAGSSKFDGNRTLPVTPLFPPPACPTKRACSLATRFCAQPRLLSAANEVNRRILQLKIAH